MSDSGALTTRRLVLEPLPASASTARRWIRDQLRNAGRDELVECAELATSELVTNAILHAHTTVTVVLESRADRLRIAISDLAPGTVAPTQQPDSQVWPSGRGLHILSVITHRWGVDEDPPGKQVWFEPLSAEDHVGHATGPTPSASRNQPAGASTRRAQLRQAPVSLLRQARQRMADLHREMLLITYTPRQDADGSATGAAGHDIPERLVELAQAMEPMTSDLLPDALLVADDSANLSCLLPPAGVDVAAWAHLLDEADDYCRTEHLLTLAAPRREALARRWFLTEVARQSAGQPPRSWPDYLAAS